MLELKLLFFVILNILCGNGLRISERFLDDNNPFTKVIRDKTSQLFSLNYNNFTLKREYDFIIVGAGPAGCVLANRLSEDPSVSVLLLEAGKPELFLFLDTLLGSPNLQSSQYNWNYITEPQERACQSMDERRCRFPHGRGLGGSTLLNYMIYTRGNRRDFDRWNAAGNNGWSYDEVLPYFIKSEDAHLERSDESFHGKNGPLYVEDIPFRSKIAEAYVQSAQEFGFPHIDYNSREQIGVSFIQSTSKKGWRYTAAESYLQPIRDRRNLHISTESWVTKLLFSKQNPTKVKGVRFVKNKKEFITRASKEVVIAAGTFQSPKLLMLSGIGPKNDLENLGITVRKDLPVGQALFEHLTIYGPIYTVDNVNDGLLSIEDLFTINHLTSWFQGKGPLTTNGAEALLYFKTNFSRDSDPNFPDIEMMSALSTIGFDTAPGTRLGLGLSLETYNQVFLPLSKKRSFLFLPMLLHPESKGVIKLKSTNPFHHPLFYPNFYSVENDINTHIAAIRMAQEIIKQPSFQKLGVKAYAVVVPGCENFTFDTDEYWKCYVMHLTSPIHHQVGTCKMGPESDPTAVVNDQLLVHGFDNLRVINVAIIPEPPSGHTSAYAFMLGEKGSDMIKEKWNIR